ncbi:MAG: hypothetical protein PHS95_03160, partial [Candidatus Pacebacteria bacterium]|nr:hypothetical protein [Candidatus Paceibacterota bacterium]
VTKFEGKYYTFYTALSEYPFSAKGIKIAVAISSDLKTVDERHLVTPFNAKAATLFPERIGGKATLLLTADTDGKPSKIAFAQADDIEDFWKPAFWEKWYAHIDEHIVSSRRTQYDHTEIGAPPIKTPQGWLLLYSYIQNYFPHPENLNRIFGIEGLLLDFDDPQKIVGHTSGPILVPTEAYELSGQVDNIVFPSGALVTDDTLTIYYGATDTTVCIAHVNLTDLLSKMRPETAPRYRCKRANENPIISPILEHSWESKATFNPAAIQIGKTTHILYRAMSEDNTSTLGYASTEDGVTISERLPLPVYVPREDFELKKVPGGNSGCEDPRLTQVGKKIYMCYTAYDGVNIPRVAVTSISEKNFVEHNWKWEKPILMTPGGFDDKDACIFPEKFDEGYFVLHRVAGQVCADYVPSLNFKKEIVDKCMHVFGPRVNAWDGMKVGVAAPPIKTPHGWLLLYHGISRSHGTYRVGAVLLDKDDPTVVISRSTDPIFEPEEPYEKVGIVNNVVFPCGITKRDELLYVYYGGGDKVIGVATIELDLLIQTLLNGVKYQ